VILRTWIRRQPWNRRSIAVIGDQKGAAAVAERIERHPEWCLDIRFRIQPDPDEPARYFVRSESEDSDPLAIREGAMIEYLRSRGVDRTVVVGASEGLSARSALIRKLAGEGIAIDHVVGGPETLYSSAQPQHLEGLTVISLRPSRRPLLAVAMKRALDVILSAALLLLALPFLAIAALSIRLGSPGPVLYRQSRCGRNGQTFQLLKLRTMSPSPRADGPSPWTSVGDSRITAVGSVLRRLRIDELPQLLNVLKGEMSLIGPRPEQPELEEDLDRRIPHYRKRHWMRPGLSGWAQVCAPYASSLEEAELKLSYDLYYLRHWSTALDLLVLFKTIKTVLQARGR
jgi:exopolysaccharide biosynthesis polyprenyl glycosylphosphotransferase